MGFQSPLFFLGIGTGPAPLTTHYPGVTPQITLSGRSFYVRTGTPRHRPVPKSVAVGFALDGTPHRGIFISDKEWAYTIACRNWDDRMFLENLANNVSYETYAHEFLDGVTHATYTVTMEELGAFTPVTDNVYVWDVPIVLSEWT